MARVADRRRGWGRFCSKRCKAIKQTYGRYAVPTKFGAKCNQQPQAGEQEET